MSNHKKLIPVGVWNSHFHISQQGYIIEKDVKTQPLILIHCRLITENDVCHAILQHRKIVDSKDAKVTQRL